MRRLTSVLMACGLFAACAIELHPDDESLQKGHYRVVDVFEGVAGIFGHGMSHQGTMHAAPGMHGRDNDLGETHDPRRLTIAHRNWRPGTLVRVTSLASGYTAIGRVTMTIETQGRSRLIDVSPMLATLLDFGYLGREEVRVELLAPAWEGDRPVVAGTTAPAKPLVRVGKFAILCGTLADESQARAMAREISRFVPDAWVEPSGGQFRVLASATDDKAEAEKRAKQVVKNGYEAQVIER